MSNELAGWIDEIKITEEERRSGFVRSICAPPGFLWSLAVTLTVAAAGPHKLKIEAVRAGGSSWVNSAKRYSRAHRCPKCGNDTPMSQYIEVGERRYGKETKRWGSSFAPRDLIIRTCSNCGHQWDEEPLDA